VRALTSVNVADRQSGWSGCWCRHNAICRQSHPGRGLRVGRACLGEDRVPACGLEMGRWSSGRPGDVAGLASGGADR